MTRERIIRLTTIGAVCLIYLVLRLWRLTDSCLWFDEIFSLHAATETWTGLFRLVADDLIHPPLFYLLLKIWISVFGDGQLAARLFPVFFSCLALVPFLFICRELKLSTAACVSALLLLTFNGALIKYAQEVRMYSPFFCLALFSLWIFLRYLRLGKNFWVLSLVNLLLVYTHYFGWLVVGAEIAAILVLQRIKIGQMAAMLGLLVAAFAPWLVAIWRAAGDGDGLAQNIGWIARPDFSALWQFAADLVEPFYYQQSSAEAASKTAVVVPLVLVFAASIALYFFNWKSKDAEEKKRVVLLLIFIVLPVIAALLASWVAPYAVWGTRHLIFVFAPVAVLFALLLDKIDFEPLKIGLIALCLSLFAAAFLLQVSRPAPVYVWCAWENLAAGLDDKAPRRIYVFEDIVAYNLWYALRAAEPRFEIVKISGIEGVVEDRAYFLPRGFDEIKTTDENGIAGARVLLAFRDAVWNEKHPPVRNFRLKGYRFGEPRAIDFGGVKAFLVEAEKIGN